MRVIATAGHVDHGKSALVRALTGMEPDRWAEERRRGMTIDLGFAWTRLPSGEQVAFVDVPGHVRFVPNMLAGVGPVPAVLFVVAADGGWMPQSAEHLAAIDALGIRHGVLAVTRSDLADPGPVLAQAGDIIARTSLGQVPAVAVSAVTGTGLSELIAALAALAARLPDPDPVAPVRIWVDRVFSMTGTGTVVTGTLPAGTIRAGDGLVVTPSLRPVRIRGLQSLGQNAAELTGVARVALSLRGIDRDELARGMALVRPDEWILARALDVRIATDLHPLPQLVTVHIGSARTPARMRSLGDRLARLHLREPLPLHVGERLLLRDPGSAASQRVWGAVALDVDPPPLRRRGAAAGAVAELSRWPDRPGAAHLLRRHRLVRAGRIAAMGVSGLPPPVAPGWLADPDAWSALASELTRLVAAHAARDPLAAGLPEEAARAALGLPDRRLVRALAIPPLAVEAGLLSARPGPAAVLPAQLSWPVGQVLADLAEHPFRAPEASRLRELGLDARALATAARHGALLRIADQIALAPGADRRAATVLAGLPQPFTAAQAREALGTTRRTLIPLLEHLDRAGLTRRLPDDRREVRSGTRAAD
jgi:selenocysteine-specific elongation factor